eukprot:COSAG02_NODE_12_length_58022_cov_242.077379_5_plen_214_part_00
MAGQGGNVLEAMAAARERMAAARSRHESQLQVAEGVLARRGGEVEVSKRGSQQAIRSELASLLQVAQQLRDNGIVLEQAAAEERARLQAPVPAPAYAEAPAVGSASPPPRMEGYGDIQSELEALQIEAEEFNSELEVLHRSVDEAAGKSTASQTSSRGDTIGMLSGLRLTTSRRELTVKCGANQRASTPAIWQPCLPSYLICLPASTCVRTAF